MEANQPSFGVIYKITNMVNGKVYVGQTVCSLSKRWREHKCGAGPNGLSRYLYNAMRKHGINKFNMAVLEDMVPFAELGVREGHWITMLESSNPKRGYNRTTGGERVEFTPDVRKKLSKSMKAWWDKQQDRTFITEIWNVEKRAKQRETSKRWRATPEGIAASKRVGQRVKVARACQVCGQIMSGQEWWRHTTRKSGCPTVAHIPPPKQFNDLARKRCSEASRIWWENHPEAKVRSPEYRKKISDSIKRLHECAKEEAA